MYVCTCMYNMYLCIVVQSPETNLVDWETLETLAKVPGSRLFVKSKAHPAEYVLKLCSSPRSLQALACPKVQDKMRAAFAVLLGSRLDTFWL